MKRDFLVPSILILFSTGILWGVHLGEKQSEDIRNRAIERQTRALENTARAQWAQVYWLKRATFECSESAGHFPTGFEAIVDPE